LNVETGYEISGFDKIPDEGPALLVYYHGALPIDLYYLMANVILHKRRCLRAVGDRFLFSIPGIDVICYYSLLFLVMFISLGQCILMYVLPSLLNMYHMFLSSVDMFGIIRRVYLFLTLVLFQFDSHACILM